MAKENNVDSMPTFVLLKKGKEVGRVVGAKQDELHNKIMEHNQIMEQGEDPIVS